jgi:hypothetical protein
MATVRFVVLILVVAGSAATADAANATSSEAFIRKGVELRKAGEHAAALDAFLRAHEASRSGRSLALVGLARQSLRQWLEAYDCLQGALATPESWVQKNRGSLEQALEVVRSHIGWLVVTGPEGAKVFLDERALGMLPMKEARVEEGRHLVRVEKQGAKPWSRTVTLLPAKTSEVVAMLEAETAQSVVEAMEVPAPGVDLRSGGIKPTSSAGTVGAAVAGAGLTLAVVGTVVMIEQEEGMYGTFDPGATGPALLAAGLVAAAAGGIVMYLWNR